MDRGDAWVSVEARFRALAEDYQGRVHSSITIHALNTLPTADQRHEFFLKPRSEAAPSEGDGPQPSANILASTSRQSVYQSTNEAGTPGGRSFWSPPAQGISCCICMNGVWMPRTTRNRSQSSSAVSSWTTSA
ncbi:hypothetical protein [Verrucomicrobium spinosum]|uniref:hypothetical protein n=1 Tax=Verrucomicrobium spinosum TaxID=2736 RepID=UPI000946783D|nr:hypothetical protein [Verrucomicrobium spinosum]